MMWLAVFIYGNQQVGARRAKAWVPAPNADEVRTILGECYNIAYYESITRYTQVKFISKEDKPYKDEGVLLSRQRKRK